MRFRSLLLESATAALMILMLICPIIARGQTGVPTYAFGSLGAPENLGGDTPGLVVGSSTSLPLVVLCSQYDANYNLLGYLSDSVVNIRLSPGSAIVPPEMLPSGVTIAPLPLSSNTSGDPNTAATDLTISASDGAVAGQWDLALVGDGTNPQPAGCYGKSTYFGTINFSIYPTVTLTRNFNDLTAQGLPQTGGAPEANVSQPVAGTYTASMSAVSTCYIGAKSFQCPGPVLSSTANDSGQFTLGDPPNPTGLPNPGEESMFLITYGFHRGTALGYGADASTWVPAFGTSCYNTTFQPDWGNATTPPGKSGACKFITYQGVRYSGTETNPFGGSLPGTFCESFDLEFALQGSGALTNGTLIKFNVDSDEGGVEVGTVTVGVPQILGAQGDAVLAGMTGARDPKIIPLKVAGGGFYNLELDGVANVIRMNDVGSAIKGYRIDRYMGVGKDVCAGYPNPILNSACSPSTPAKPDGPPLCTNATYVSPVLFEVPKSRQHR